MARNEVARLLAEAAAAPELPDKLSRWMLERAAA